MITLTMRAMFFSVVLSLFIRAISNEQNPISGFRNIDLARWPTTNLMPQSPTRSNSNPCDAAKIKGGAQTADSACRKECLALKENISIIYDAYSDYKSATYLHNNCGKMTEGKCYTASSFPSCYCITSRESEVRLINTLTNCRIGIQLVRKFTDAVARSLVGDKLDKSISKRKKSQEMGGSEALEAVHMQQNPAHFSSTGIPTGRRSTASHHPNPHYSGSGSTSSFSSRVHTFPAQFTAGTSVVPPRSPQREPEGWSSSGVDNLLEVPGGCLYMFVAVAGYAVEAMLDTGAAFCVVNKEFADDYVAFNMHISGIENQIGFQALGKTQLNVLTSNGVDIPVSAYVVEQTYGVVLGSDFFLAYNAKIKISEKKMEILIDGRIAEISIFLKSLTSVNIGMMNDSNLGGFAALQISARLNGITTRVVIDTGASITLVNRNLVNEQTLHSVATTCSLPGNRSVGFLGLAYINLSIESKSLIVSAHVPHFIPRVNLLTGNDFNEKYVELIDYESKLVTLKLPGPTGYGWVVTSAFITEGQ